MKEFSLNISVIEQQIGNQDIPGNFTIEVDDVWCKDPNLPLSKLAIAAM